MEACRPHGCGEGAATRVVVVEEEEEAEEEEMSALRTCMRSSGPSPTGMGDRKAVAVTCVF